MTSRLEVVVLAKVPSMSTKEILVTLKGQGKQEAKLLLSNSEVAKLGLSVGKRVYVNLSLVPHQQTTF